MRDILLHISIVGFVIAVCGFAIDATEGRLPEILIGVGMITSIFVGLASLYVNEDNDKKEKAKAKVKLEEDNRERWENLLSTAKDKLVTAAPCVVSLLPPDTSCLDNKITAAREKDIYLGKANNREEAFALMRDYLNYNLIAATDVSELKVHIYDSDDRLVETTSMIKFTLGDEHVSFNYDTMLCKGAIFLLRFTSTPKYETLPLFEDWCSDKRSRSLNEYVYRNVSNYLKSKEGNE